MDSVKGVFISEEMANDIRGNEFVAGCKFNPVQDDDGRWFVSEIEAKHLEGVGSAEPLFRYTTEQRVLRMQQFIQLQSENSAEWFAENEAVLNNWLTHGGDLDLID